MRTNTIAILLLLLLIVGGYYWYSSQKKVIAPAPIITTNPTIATPHTSAASSTNKLTNENLVIAFIRKNGHLPDYYFTKNKARSMGWIASQGNLCDVLPGKAIGGDVFTNREKSLPVKKGRTWYEADINYDCGRRNADRLLFSNDGFIFITKDHYKTFQEK